MKRYGVDAFRFRHALPAVILGLAIVACAAPPAPAMTSAAVTASATLPPTATPAPTRARPASTLPPTATPAPTRAMPASTLAFTDPAVDPTALVSVVMTAQPLQVLRTLVSPDGRWRAQVDRYDCTRTDDVNGDEIAYEQLTLTDVATGETGGYMISSKSAAGSGPLASGDCIGRMAAATSFTRMRAKKMPDGGCLGWYRSATRLDPVNGEKVGLVQGPQSPTGGW